MACSVADLSDYEENTEFAFLGEALSTEGDEGDIDENSGSDEAYQPSLKKRQRIVSCSIGEHKDHKVPRRRELIAKEGKRSGKGRSRKKRFRYDYEQKAKVVAYYDSLPAKVDGVRVKIGTRLEATRKDGPVNVDSTNTLKTWTTQKARARIEFVVGHSISAYGPDVEKIVNKGGRGVKAPGRNCLVIPAVLMGRKLAKYPLAEQQTVMWMRARRKKGIKLTTRIAKAAMKLNVRRMYADDDSSLGFKASSGWMKRFMARFGITWRRRNDNATKSAAQLMPSVANFINDLRAFRVDSPSVLVGDLDAVPSEDGFAARFGKYGPYNTFNVDQHPLPFASCDPCTLDFIGTERVWIKQPGSGLDKRQATLQLMVRPLGPQPLPCLLFRGAMEPNGPKRTITREQEELKYDKDCVVLWQAKAWADTATCVAWAKGPFADFVSDVLDGGDTLVLADNLGAQTKDVFTSAMEEGGAVLKLGPAGATHVWQPCDHHLGREYGRLMGHYYDEWMCSEFEHMEGAKVDVARRRILLTEWAAKAYHVLEAERREKEGPWLAGVAGAEPSRFYKAFLRTGCLVTRDGTLDEEIVPHNEIKDALLVDFRSRLFPPGAQPKGDEWDGIIHLSSSEASETESGDESAHGNGDDDVWNTDDADDEPEFSGDEGQEPVPAGMELQLPADMDIMEVEDEQTQIRAARAAAYKGGDVAEIRDFDSALRIAQQDGVAVAPSFTGARDGDYNARKNALFKKELANHEASIGRPATRSQWNRIWEQVGIAAMQNPDDPLPVGRSRLRRSRAH